MGRMSNADAVRNFGSGECPVCDARVILMVNGRLRIHRAHPSVLEDSPGANCYGSHGWAKPKSGPDTGAKGAPR